MEAGGGGRELPEQLRRLEQALSARAEAGQIAVPPYPAVALRVQEVMGRKDFDLGEVAELVGADAVLADEQALVATGDEPLPEKRLLEAKLHGPQPFTVWVLSRRCRRDGAAYEVELQPFALSGPVKERWSELVAGEPPRP